MAVSESEDSSPLNFERGHPHDVDDDDRNVTTSHDRLSDTGGNKSSESALRENIRTKGQNAYYYAHNRNFHVPENAIVRTGPGIITGGAPTPLEKPDFDCSLTAAETKRTASTAGALKIDKYLLVDENEKIQVIVDFDELAAATKMGTVTFEVVSETSILLLCTVTVGDGAVKKYHLTCENLKHAIVPEKSKHRVNKDKNKVTVTCVKQIPQKWGQLQKTDK
eukprot:g16910.t1